MTLTIRISPRLVLVAAIVLAAGIAYGVYAAIIATEDRPTGVFRVEAGEDLVVKTYRVDGGIPSGTVTEDDTLNWCAHEAMPDEPSATAIYCIIGVTQSQDASTVLRFSAVDVDNADGLGLANKIFLRTRSHTDIALVCPGIASGAFPGALGQGISAPLSLGQITNPAVDQEQFLCIELIYNVLPGQGEPAPAGAQTSATFRVDLDDQP